MVIYINIMCLYIIRSGVFTSKCMKCWYKTFEFFALENDRIFVPFLMLVTYAVSPFWQS
jgi:hypothetical protein